ncbi:MAG TPA: transporter substrate-binding domain-containing protein, partial [Lacunisphaera sp.]|nr:transporter substrate-binding domain-containing protein [Lacunisphaera sp.]
MIPPHHPALLARLMVLAVALLAGPGGAYAAGNVESKTVRLGVLTDNYPFSFTGPDGQMQGFSYELLREVETVMGLRFERVHGVTKEVNSAFLEGRIDMLQ